MAELLFTSSNSTDPAGKHVALLPMKEIPPRQCWSHPCSHFTSRSAPMGQPGPSRSGEGTTTALPPLHPVPLLQPSRGETRVAIPLTVQIGHFS